MNRWSRTRLAAGLLAAAAAAVTPGITTAQASTATTGISTISTPAGQCVTALDGQVTMSPCAPSTAAQQWVFTPGHRFRLNHTRKYLDPGTSGTVLSGYASAGRFLYTGPHLLIVNGSDLFTWCTGDPSPYLLYGESPNCQTFYVFTQG